MLKPTVFAVISLLAVSVAAQRGASSLKHASFESALDFGQPVWGKRSLEDLPVGQNWRLGMNQASSWRTQTPLVQGSVVIAPGHYRVGLQRSGEEDFAIEFASAALAVSGTGSASLTCKLGKDEVAKKLAIELAKADAKAKVAADGELPAQFRVRFGPHRIEGDFAMVGGRELASSAKFRLVGWSLPAKAVEDALAAGQSVPVATFFAKKPGNKDPEFFNVVVSSKGAELLPGLLMPTESFGFGEVAAPLSTLKQPAEVTWSDLEQATTRLEFGAKAERKDKRYVLELRCGKRAATLKVGEPEAKS